MKRRIIGAPDDLVRKYATSLVRGGKSRVEVHNYLKSVGLNDEIATIVTTVAFELCHDT